MCSSITFPSGSLWRRRLSRSSPFYLGRPPPWDDWFKCHQCHHHVFEYFLGWFSPHFFKIKTLLTLPWRGSWHASPGCPAPPLAAPVPGSRASCHHHFDKHCDDQMIILINIIRWSFSFKHHNDFLGSGRPFSIGWYHAPYPIDCYADFWCFSWLTWWWFSDVAKTDGLPKWRLNIQDDPRWWKISDVDW